MAWCVHARASIKEFLQMSEMAKAFTQMDLRPQTSCAVEEESLPAGILDDHNWAIVVLQAAGDLGSASLQDCHILCLHCLAAGCGRERLMFIKWCKDCLMESKDTERGERREQMQKSKKREIHNTLEIESFKIRYLTHCSLMSHLS